MFRGYWQCAFLILLVAGAGEALGDCMTQHPDFRAEYRAGTANLNDYGAIQMDADNGGGWPVDCAKLAHDALITKIRTTPDEVFDDSLQGYIVAMMFASAQRIAAYGWFNTANDPLDATYTLSYQLNRVLGLYQVESHATGCGTGLRGNSCMDDHAGAAAAYGWISAFKKARGDGDTWQTAMWTGDRITWFFENVCIHDPAAFAADNSSFCNVPNDQWARIGEQTSHGPVKTISFEHEFQSPHYGLGLMTSIASAIIGLEAAGAGYTLDDAQRAKAMGMMRELNETTELDAEGKFVYRQDCLNPDFADPANPATSPFVMGPVKPCKDVGEDGVGLNYDPKMYHMYEFFVDRVATPTGNYKSDDACCLNWPGDVTNFDRDAGREAGAGRFATYHGQGWTWFEAHIDPAKRPTRYMPRDQFQPKGWLDGVDNNGVAAGWACDGDAPNGWVKIDFYADGVKLPDDLEDQYAWWGSEQAVADQCNGGSAHRFYAQLPPQAWGKTITARVRDFTFGPDQAMGCGEYPSCRW